MKIKAVFLAALALCVLLAGCSVQPLSDLLSEPTTEEATTQRTIPRPSVEDVENAFDKATEVYGWFDLCALESDSADKMEHGGRTYFRVVSDAVPSYDVLRTLVFDLFDTQTGERLLDEDSDAPPYIDVNGALYAQDFARGSDITKGDHTLTVEWESMTCALCHVQVETLEFGDQLGDDYRRVTGHEDYTFRYELVGRRWVFTDFQLFY